MELIKKIKSLLVTKTGQTVNYNGPDDGLTQYGWWSKRKIADNRSRYVTKTIGGDDIVIDKATGLTWPADGNEAGCNSGVVITWGLALSYAANLTFAGYSDWRLPSAKEGVSLMKMDYATWFASEALLDSPPFVNIKFDRYWTSTTFPAITANAYKLNFSNATISSDIKTGNLYLICVRGGI